MYNATVPTIAVPSNSATQQQKYMYTTTGDNSNPLIDKGTYTYIPVDRNKRKSSHRKVVVHRSRNPTPSTSKIVVEKPRRHRRLPRNHRSTTIVQEHTTKIPHTTTTAT